MKFLRRQEESLATRYLLWQYQKNQIPTPPYEELEKQACQIVDDAHRIARERGSNLISIIKELAHDFIKKR
ncbi:MAG: hypothetical protein JRD93_03720 [Deltaproteobacteria bacterium]|nr:hypothetical protein [Deltaproteobacteria bacterium]MBW2661102.1 hypothetical protein [Deltaproteobacteria bacterium]